MELNNITNTGTWGEQVTRLNDNFNKVAMGIDTLQSIYESLSQSDIEPVAAADWPVSNPQENIIYRVTGTTSYSDYMWNGSVFVKMAEYNNAIDDEPTAGSNNLVKSGGVFGIYEKLGTDKDLSRTDFTIVDGVFINGEGKFGVGNHCEYMYLPVEENQVFKLSRGNTAGYDGAYVFLASITANPSFGQMSDNVGCGYVLKGETISITIPSGCNFLAISNLNYGTNMALDKIEQINEYNFTNVKEEINEINEEIVQIKSCELSENDFIIFNGAFINGDGRFGVSSNCQYMYRKVRQGEKYELTRNNTAGNDGAYVFLVSITENPTFLEESDNVGCGYVLKGETISITIPSGCNFLAISNLNYGTNMRMDKIVSHSYVVQEEINALKNPKKKIYCIPVYGQSLAIGIEAVRISSYSRFPDNCLTTSSLTLSYSGDNEVSSYGLVDSLVDNFAKENRASAKEQDFKVLSFAGGQGSSSIMQLKKGTQKYTEFISAITTSYNNALNEGWEFIVPAFCWVQGEQDRFDTYTNDYKGELAQLREDLDEDIKLITGQTEDVYCICYQTNQLSASNVNQDEFDADSYNSGRNGALISVPQAQYELIRDNQYFVPSTPIYPMSFVAHADSQDLHITSQSQKLLGYYEGLAAKRVMDGHGCNIGLVVTNITKVDNTHLKLTLNTLCPPLMIDTVSVNEVANYGFSVITSDNTNIISNVEISPSHYSKQEITITTSTNCSGAKLRYGINGQDGASGYWNGSRGNIRDSQGDLIDADINGIRVKMHNWLYFLEYLIS